MGRSGNDKDEEDWENGKDKGLLPEFEFRDVASEDCERMMSSRLSWLSPPEELELPPLLSLPVAKMCRSVGESGLEQTEEHGLDKLLKSSSEKRAEEERVALW